MKYLQPANNLPPPPEEGELEDLLTLLDTIARAKFNFQNLVPLWSEGALRALEEGGVDLSLTREPYQQLRLYHRTFRALGTPPGEANMGELSDRLGLTVSSTTRLIDGLVGRGLLGRREAPQDRRVVLVGLTPLGERFAGVLDRAIRDRLRQGMRQLTPTERAQLVRLLTRLFDLWTDAPGDPPPQNPPHGDPQ